MKNPIILTLLFGALFLRLNGQTLSLDDNEIHEIKPGTYTFDQVTLGQNAIILLTGSTRLSIKKLDSAPGARIEYKKGASKNDNAKFLELAVLDGSKMRGTFSINGSGEDGKHGDDGDNGGKGGDEHEKTKSCWGSTLGVKYKYPCGVEVIDPTPGGNGTNGTDGKNGEEAVDLDVSMYKVDPSAHVILISNGGAGGDGGNGGNGGNGGRGKRIERGQPGGNGGDGGDAGSGGDAGNISVILVYKDNTPKDKLKELQDFLENNIHAIPGLGGRPGAAGVGGEGGDGGKGGRVGVGDIGIQRGGGKGGSSGKNGEKGSPGDNGDVNKQLMEGLEWLKLKKNLLDKVLQD